MMKITKKEDYFTHTYLGGELTYNPGKTTVTKVTGMTYAEMETHKKENGSRYSYVKNGSKYDATQRA